MAYTTDAKIQQNLLTPTDQWVFLLEFSHTALASPILFVVDTSPIIHLGAKYAPMAARLTLPRDEQNQVASASLTLDNVTQTIARIIEDTGGFRGVVVTVKMVYRSRPDIVELDHEFDLLDIQMTPTVVSGTLSYNKIMDLTVAPMSYRPATKPGLF